MSSPTVTITLKAEDLATGKIQGAMNNVEQASQKVQEKTRALTTSGRELVTGFSAVATAAVSVGLQFDRLEKIELTIAKSHKQVDQASLNLSKAQEELNKLAAEGKQGTEDYQQALQRYSVAQQQAAIASEQLRLRENDKNQAMLQFGLSIGPTAMTAYSGLGQILPKVTKASESLKLSMLTSPWGIAAIAIGAVATALFVVTDGFKNWKPVIDAVNASIQFLLIPIKGLLLLIGQFVPEAKAAVEALNNLDVGALGNLIPTASAMTVEAQGLAGGLSSVATAAENAADNIKHLKLEAEEQVDFSKLFGGFSQQGIAGPFKGFFTPEKDQELVKQSLENQKKIREEHERKVTAKEEDETKKRVSLQNLLFNNFTAKSEEFQSSLAATTAKISFLLEDGTKTGLNKALGEMDKFVKQWGTSWETAVSLVERRLDELAKKQSGLVQRGPGGASLSSGTQGLFNQAQIFFNQAAAQRAQGNIEAAENFERAARQAQDDANRSRREDIAGLQLGGLVTKAGLFELHAGEAVASSGTLERIERLLTRQTDAIERLASRTQYIETTLHVMVNSSAEIGKVIDVARDVGRAQVNQSDLFRPLRLT